MRELLDGVLGLAALAAGALAVLALAGGGAALAALVAVLLPAAGLGALLRPLAPDRGRAAAAGLLLWSSLALAGMPAWIDRGGALEAGLARVGGSPEAAAWLDARLPAVARRPAEPAAEGEGGAPAVAIEPEPPPAPSVAIDLTAAIDEDAEDAVVLPYEGTASAMRLPVTIEVGGAGIETEMIFDTGASLTVVSSALLAELGYRVPRGAPTARMQTANGSREAPLILIDRLWLGGFAVEGVTASVCDNCGDIQGLIGLNVSSAFRVQVDQQRRELLFHPSNLHDRSLDVNPWLDWSGTLRRGRLLEVHAVNKAPRPVAEARLDIGCGEAAVTLEGIPAGGAATGELRVPAGCQPRLRLAEARW